ncbi:MAG: beta-Ala-His dipeptidase, partial [Syntrophales bacterium]|nr:beta-Ala-His dipeptidase [Syntrophales bacterium]
WDHFYQLTQIPHPSGGEQAVCRYIYRLAEDLCMEVKMDKAGGSDFGNVLVKCPPSPGCEKAPITIFQSHLDMVALPEANRDLPLNLILDGSVLRARGNTLGADNGIAVAMALSFMTNPDIVHGPMELLFTINEEAGMTGVRMLSDSVLEGSFLINVDSQQEGVLTVCSAGANRSIFQLPLKMDATTMDLIPVRISLVGGKGGHSGLEINSGRANVGQLLVRILYEESKTIPLCLNEVNWGSVDNAIPPDAHTVMLIRPEHLDSLKNALQKWDKNFVEEFGKSEGSLRIMLTEGIPRPEFALGTMRTKHVFSFLLALPHGVHTMSRELGGLVETSSNVAIVRTSPTGLTVNVSERSMSDPSLDAIITKCEAVANLAGAELAHIGKTYGWKPNIESPLLTLCRDAYHQVYGEDPKVVGLHGMLECGLIKTKYPHIDMISLGPTILDAHAPTKPDFVSGVDSGSTGERIDTARIPRFWEFVKTVLKKLSELGG